MSATGIAVSMRGVSIRFGKTRVVDDFDWDIPVGGVTALVGENGAGKSTILDAILGLVRPTSGQLMVLGKDPTKDGVSVRSRIGYVESEPAFDPDETAASTIALHRRVRDTWDDKIAEPWISRLRLPLSRRIRALSRGERAKLALLLAMAPQPDLLVFDEPFDGLDVGARDEVERAIFDHLDGSERTVLLASHDIGEIERLADRVAVLADGRICAYGSPDDVRRKVERFSVPSGSFAILEAFDDAARVQSAGNGEVVTCHAGSALAEHLILQANAVRLPTSPLREAVRHLAHAKSEPTS